MAPSLANSNGNLIMKVVNATDSISISEIILDGAKGPVNASATVITSISGKQYDENTIAQAAKVSFTSASFPASRHFKYSFPAHSVTVLRIGSLLEK